MASGDDSSWKWIAGISIVGMIVITLAAWSIGYWVLTALPVGFLFGFFLEKADLCGSSAFSEVLLFRDWKKIQGIWVVIVVSMVGFSLLTELGMVKLNPKPLLWASYIVGGLIFGIGMVFAGACVSGSLFKVGQGNLNSMAALVGIPIGVMMVEHGPLNTFHKTLKNFVIPNSDGGPVTFFSVLHVPYWTLAVIFAATTIIAIFYYRRKNGMTISENNASNTSSIKKILTSRWRPWQAGVAIGVLACMAYLSSAASGRNYPLGVTHGVMHAELLLTETSLKYVYAPKKVPPTPVNIETPQKATPPKKKVSIWLVFEICAIVLGSFVSAKLSGKAKLLPKPPQETITAYGGGLMVGTGASIAGGCVVGNIMSGLALMSVGNLLFVVSVVLANWVTTYFYLMGGSLGDLVEAPGYLFKNRG